MEWEGLGLGGPTLFPPEIPHDLVCHFKQTLSLHSYLLFSRFFPALKFCDCLRSTDNLCPSSLGDDKFAGLWGAYRGAVAWVERGGWCFGAGGPAWAKAFKWTSAVKSQVGYEHSTSHAGLKRLRKILLAVRSEWNLWMRRMGWTKCIEFWSCKFLRSQSEPMREYSGPGGDSGAVYLMAPGRGQLTPISGRSSEQSQVWCC